LEALSLWKNSHCKRLHHQLLEAFSYVKYFTSVSVFCKRLQM
jgi:hypothetical protein